MLSDVIDVNIERCEKFFSKLLYINYLNFDFTE